MRQVPLEVKVWGDFACFTRPEMKVERVSYPVMTPSAARGVLEAIFWKPEFSWRIREIQVLQPIRYFSILRNEVNNVASQRSAQGWRKDGGGYFADEDRAQRHTLALRDVAYVIRADMALKSHANADPAKYPGSIPPPGGPGPVLPGPLPGLPGVRRLFWSAGNNGPPFASGDGPGSDAF